MPVNRGSNNIIIYNHERNNNSYVYRRAGTVERIRAGFNDNTNRHDNINFQH